MDGKKLSEIIIAYRTANKMSLSAFAKKAGITKSFIFKIEKDETGVTYSTLQKLAVSMNKDIINLVLEIEGKNIESFSSDSLRLKKLTEETTQLLKEVNDLKQAIEKRSPLPLTRDDQKKEVEMLAEIYTELKKQNPSPIPVGTLKRDWIASQTTIGRITVQKYLTGEYSGKTNQKKSDVKKTSIL